MAAAEDLARDFSAEGATWGRGPGDLPFLTIETRQCAARVTPYGAHVCAWTPAGQTTSALFLSPRAVFAPGRAIRGGVPICFPWFANHPTDPAKPAHGFARTQRWRVTDLIADETGQVHLALRLAADDVTRTLWDAEFVATFTVSLGTALRMTLEVANEGARDIVYESALHTYLAVGDVEQVRITGLEDTRFIDKVDGGRERRAGRAPLTLTGDTDRVYLDTTATCVVDDPVLHRRIHVEKRNSSTTVVWNPGAAKAQSIPDIGESWRHFICVETANTSPHAVRLPPNARHTTTAHLTLPPR
jgi:D-hexose-6-phosphate mutarotase